MYGGKLAASEYLCCSVDILIIIFTFRATLLVVSRQILLFDENDKTKLWQIKTIIINIIMFGPVCNWCSLQFERYVFFFVCYLGRCQRALRVIFSWKGINVRPEVVCHTNDMRDTFQSFFSLPLNVFFLLFYAHFVWLYCVIPVDSL